MKLFYYSFLFFSWVTIALATMEEFPPPLTENTFKEEIANGLHVIEFFSPSCHHCRALEPKWKEAWSIFQEESKKLNIKFSQVNCLESGDLCNDQNIAYYPTIRLYDVNGIIKDFPEGMKRSSENLIKFARKEAVNPQNVDIDKVQSVSEEMTDVELVNLLAGKGKVPYLVSFWPSKNLKGSDDSENMLLCDNCVPFQRTWKILSTILMNDGIHTAHLNCERYPVLCKELKFDDLASIDHLKNGNRDPKVALILPNKTTNNLFIYDKNFGTDVALYEDYTRRLFQNSQVPEITIEEISGFMNRNIDFTSSSEGSKQLQGIHMIFAYDPSTVVSEDFDILEYLFEPLSNFPNVYLHQYNNSLIDLTHDGYTKMYDRINYKQEGPEKVLDEQYFALSTITQMPTFFLIKDGCIIPSVFPGYSTTEMRNPDTILTWFKQNAAPFIADTKLSTIDSLVNYEKDIYNTLVVLYTDTHNVESKVLSNKYVDNIITAWYSYEDQRMKFILENVLDQRKHKELVVQDLREKKAKSTEINNALRREIDHINDLKIHIAFIDVADLDDAQYEFVSLDEETRNAGSVIIIDKKNKVLYQHDTKGSSLNADSLGALKETLLAINIPAYSSYSKPTGTYFGGNTAPSVAELLTPLRQIRLGHCVLLVVLIFLLVKTKQLYSKSRISRKYNAKRNTVGLLGKNNKNKFQD